MSDMRAKPVIMLGLLGAALGLPLWLIFGGSFGVLFLTALMAYTFIQRSSLLLFQRTRVRVFKIVHAAMLIGMFGFLVSFIVIEAVIIANSSTDRPAEQPSDFFVVLGAGLKGEQLSETLRRRLDTGVKVLKQSPDIPVILSGGQGPGEAVSEAEAMSKYLTGLGIPQERLILESQSTSTEENISFSKEIIDARGAVQPKITIITSDYHLFRAKLIARKNGIQAAGISSPSPFFLKINYLIREYFGVIAASLLPAAR